MESNQCDFGEYEKAFLFLVNVAKIDIKSGKYTQNTTVYIKFCASNEALETHKARLEELGKGPWKTENWINLAM